MKSSESDIKLLEDYIQGRLDESASALLIDRLEREENLKTDYHDLKLIMKATQVTKLNSKLKMLQTLGNEDNTDSGKTPVKVIARSWPNWLKTACFIGVLLVAVLYFILNKETSVPQEYADLFGDKFDTELIIHQTLRAGTPMEQLTEKQQRAFDNYSIQNFKTAKPLLKELWDSSQDTVALFYWGVSELGLGNVDEGLFILKRKELSNIPPVNKYFLKK